MRLFGVTGGVGMGKSTAGEFLRQLGVPVADTDVIAHQLVEPGQPALSEISNLFGREILSNDGSLNRRELARIVFADAAARSKLESILHPRIRAVWEAEVEKWRAAGIPTGAVIIPLLFEIHAAQCFDAVICVACSPETQLQRLRQRGWTDAEIQQRLNAQKPTVGKISDSDFVVWSDTTLESHSAQLERILQRPLPPPAQKAP
jgi:dephospho-CoA kinase